VHFAACNQEKRLASHPGSSLQVTSEMRAAEEAESTACATQAGIPYAPINAGIESGEALRLVHSPGYTHRVQAYEHQIAQAGQEILPYIFLNGNLLLCEGSTHCSAVWKATTARYEPLDQAGSLLQLVCQRLDPKPPLCIPALGQIKNGGTTPACENCAEMGKFHWRPTTNGVFQTTQATGAATVAVAAVATVAAGTLVWRWIHCGEHEHDHEHDESKGMLLAG